MSEATPHLALPLVAANQAQKHVPVNEALTKLDALVQLSVITRDLAEPPSDPGEGDRYIVAAGAAGAWIGQENAIASYESGWLFTSPGAGWLAWDQGAQELIVFTDGEWMTVSAGTMGGGSSLQNIPLLGVGAEADETNPFSAKLNGALWTASALSEGGSGDLRYVMNKEAGPNVLSLLMQSAYSGRAEIGLIGDEDLLFKVSADGSVWKDALRIDKNSGAVRFPSGGARELLTASRTYYVRPDGSDTNGGLADTPGDAFLTLQKAVDTAASLDLGTHDVVIQVADGIYAGETVLKTLIGAGRCIIQGNTGTPSNVTLSSSSRSVIGGGVPYAGRYVLKGARLTSAGTNVHAIALSGITSILEYGALDFGACTGTHLQILTGAYCECIGNYTISGNAARHFHAGGGIIWFESPKTITLSGIPAFSGPFARAAFKGMLTASGITFAGSATGVRYDAAHLSLIYVGGAGANYFPGSSAGATASGAQYV